MGHVALKMISQTGKDSLTLLRSDQKRLLEIFEIISFIVFLYLYFESWQNWKCLDEAKEKMMKWVSEPQWPSVLLLTFLVVYNN